MSFYELLLSRNSLEDCRNLQHFKVEQIFVPNEKVSIGRIEFEAGNFNTSKEKLSKFVEIFSDKYSIVLSHNTRDVVHYRTQHSSILKNTTAAPKAVFFEDKFAEVTEFLIKFSDKIYSQQKTNIGFSFKL